MSTIYENLKIGLSALSKGMLIPILTCICFKIINVAKCKCVSVKDLRENPLIAYSLHSFHPPGSGVRSLAVPITESSPSIDTHGVKRDLDKIHWCILNHLTQSSLGVRTLNLGDSVFLYTLFDSPLGRFEKIDAVYFCEFEYCFRMQLYHRRHAKMVTIKIGPGFC